MKTALEHPDSTYCEYAAQALGEMFKIKKSKPDTYKDAANALSSIAWKKPGLITPDIASILKNSLSIQEFDPSCKRTVVFSLGKIACKRPEFADFFIINNLFAVLKEEDTFSHYDNTAKLLAGIAIHCPKFSIHVVEKFENLLLDRKHIKKVWYILGALETIFSKKPELIQISTINAIKFTLEKKDSDLHDRLRAARLLKTIINSKTEVDVLPAFQTLGEIVEKKCLKAPEKGDYSDEEKRGNIISCYVELIASKTDLAQLSSIKILEKVLNNDELRLAQSTHREIIKLLNDLALSRPKLIGPSTVMALEKFIISDFSRVIPLLNAIAENKPSAMQVSTIKVLEKFLTAKKPDFSDCKEVAHCLYLIAEHKPKRITPPTVKNLENAFEVFRNFKKEDLSSWDYETCQDVRKTILSIFSVLAEKKPDLIQPSTVAIFEAEKSIDSMASVAKNRLDLVTESTVKALKDAFYDEKIIYDHGVRPALEAIALKSNDINIANKAARVIENIFLKLKSDRGRPFRNDVLASLYKITKERPKVIQASTIKAIMEALIMDRVYSKDSDAELEENISVLASIPSARPDLADKTIEILEGMAKENSNSSYACRAVHCIERMALESPDHVALVMRSLERIVASKIKATLTDDVYKVSSRAIRNLSAKDPKLIEQAIRIFERVLRRKNLTGSSYFSSAISLAEIAKENPEFTQKILKIMENILRSKELGALAYRAVAIHISDIADKKSNRKIAEQIDSIREGILKTEDLDPNAYDYTARGFVHVILANPEKIAIIEKLLKTEDLGSPAYEGVVLCLNSVFEKSKHFIKPSLVSGLKDLLETDGLSDDVYFDIFEALTIVASEKPDLINTSVVRALEKGLGRKMSSYKYSKSLEILVVIARKRKELIERSMVETLEKFLVESKNRKWGDEGTFGSIRAAAKVLKIIIEKRRDLLSQSTINALEGALEAKIVELTDWRKEGKGKRKREKEEDHIISGFVELYKAIIRCIRTAAQFKGQLIKPSTLSIIEKILRTENLESRERGVYIYSDAANCLGAITRHCPHLLQESIQLLKGILESKDLEPSAYHSAAYSLLDITRNDHETDQEIISILEKFVDSKALNSEALNGVVYALEIIAPKEPDIKKYLSGKTKLFFAWFEKGLLFQKAKYEEYIASKDPEAFLAKLTKRAQKFTGSYFDINNEEDLIVAFLGLGLKDVKAVDVNYDGFKERIEMMRSFEEKHPGHINDLFKDKGYPEINIKSKGVELSTEDVDASVLEEHLDNINSEINGLTNLSLPKEALGSDYDDFAEKVYAYISIMESIKKDPALKERMGPLSNKKLKTHLKRHKDQLKDKDISELLKALIAGKKDLFYQAIFFVSWHSSNGLRDKNSSETYARLIRIAILGRTLFAQPDLLRRLSPPFDLDKRVGSFKDLYENPDYKNYLAYAVGLPRIENIPKLSREIENFRAELYEELEKAVDITSKDSPGYRLEPVNGFLGIFRGRAGILDCSFDIDSWIGNAFTRAMHEDTVYYFVYKGKNLKGYIGLMEAETEDGKKILTIDTIQSQSLGDEKSVKEILQKLAEVAKAKGFEAIALPKSLGPALNFENVFYTIKKLPIYKEAKDIRLYPAHKESWEKFTEEFHKDRGNSIEHLWFKLIDFDALAEISLKTDEGSKSVPTKQDEDRLYAERDDELNLLRKASKDLGKYPVNMHIDLSLIPYKGLTEEQREEQLEKNVQTLALLIARNNAYGLNVRYVLENDTDDEAFILLKEKLEDLGKLPGIDAKELLSRINAPHKEEKAIEIELKNIKNIKEGESIPDMKYIVALEEALTVSEVSIPNYTAASCIGLSLAVLRLANEQGHQTYISERKRIFEKLKSIYERFGINPGGFEEAQLDMMVTGSSDTKRYYTMSYVLPPIAKAAIENLRHYHDIIHRILQAA
ncbi:MAG: hypothetical protein WBC00_04175 [Candidatus Omnitrophota bacterium]